MHTDVDSDAGARLPEVSVVVTTFRRGHLVGEAIESAIAQRGVVTEVVVVDDSPEGGAREVVEAFGPGVRYVHAAKPSGGRPGLPRNFAMAFCRAPFVHFLDDDDLLLDGALASLHAALTTRDAGMAFGRVVPFGEDAELVAKEKAYFDRVSHRARWLRGRRAFAALMLFLDSPLVNSACMVRRASFETANGYDPSLRCFEDLELHLRIAREDGAVFVDADVLRYRVGGASIMADIRGRAKHPVVRAAYGIIHERYRGLYGALEYRSLQVLARGAQRIGLA